MRLSKRSVTIIAVVLSAVLVFGLSFGILQMQSSGAVIESIDPVEYPPFNAEYIETTPQAGGSVTRTWKVDYNNLRDWRKEMIGIQGYTGPDLGFQVGTVYEFHGNTLSEKRPMTDKPIITKHENGAIPFTWMFPGHLSSLKNTGVSMKISRTATNQEILWGNNKTTLNAGGVPIEGDVHDPRDAQFKAISFTFK